MYKVSVLITTYNLENYIEHALNSVLRQKTDFDFQIIIADDASTDNTVNIINRYTKKFDNIKLLTAAKNMGSLANSNRLFANLQSEYFTFLDGDDYWVGENRLQNQVDFLDQNKQYTICAGNTAYITDGKKNGYVLKKEDLNKSYTFRDFVKNKVPFFHTSAMLVRNVIFCNGLPVEYVNALGSIWECALRGEDFRRIIHLEKGMAYLSGDVVSCYRIHKNGIWQGASEIKKIIEQAISSYYYFEYYGFKHGKYFYRNAKKSYNSMIEELIVSHSLLNGIHIRDNECRLLLNYLREINSDHKFCNDNKKMLWIDKRGLKLILRFIRKYT